jgi:hypothetical protein
MRVAHEIARLPGETAAESKTTLTNLTKLIVEESAMCPPGRKQQN